MGPTGRRRRRDNDFITGIIISHGNDQQTTTYYLSFSLRRRSTIYHFGSKISISPDANDRNHHHRQQPSPPTVRPAGGPSGEAIARGAPSDEEQLGASDISRIVVRQNSRLRLECKSNQAKPRAEVS